MSRPEKRQPAGLPGPPAPPPRHSAGFTLVEMLVTLAVFTVVLLAVLALFDTNTRLARAQVRTTDMQQSLRFAQYDMVRRIRMAARGGLPAMLPAGGVFAGRLLPKGVGIEVADNVPAGTRIGGYDQAAVLPGTDVLTVRGVFSTLYQSNPVPAGNFSLVDGNNDGLPERGTLILHNASPTGVPQDLKALADAVDTTKKGQAEALLLVSPLSDDVYAVVELAPTSDYSKVAGSVTQVRLSFNVTGTARSLGYLGLSPNGTYPQAMSTVAYAGLLEEHKYYVREVHAVAGDPTSDLRPRLSRARVYPGTDAAWKGDTANLIDDVASGVLDLQASLGVDTNGDGAVTEGADAAAKRSDEWLFNQAGDDAGAAAWNGGPAGAARLCLVRITTLARTERRDANLYQSPPLGILEDKDYADSAYAKYNSADERRYRYQTLQTSIELRNLS